MHARCPGQKTMRFTSDVDSSVDQKGGRREPSILRMSDGDAPEQKRRLRLGLERGKAAPRHSFVLSRPGSAGGGMETSFGLAAPNALRPRAARRRESGRAMGLPERASMTCCGEPP